MTVSRQHPAFIWACTIGLAILAGYAAGPIASMALMAAERWGGLAAGVGIRFIIVVQMIVFALSLVWLLRIPSLPQRIAKGLKVSGVLLLLSVPAMIAVAFVENSQAAGGDHGSAAAAFFLAMIFGGMNGVLGLILLVAGVVVGRRNKPELSQG